MAAVCPVAEPARFIASSPAIGHACSLTRFALRQPTAQEYSAHAPPRSSVALAIRLAAFEPGVIRRLATIIRRNVFSSSRLHSTLEPVFCARKEEADIECVSTTGRILAESLVMRGDFFDIRTVLFGFYSASRSCIPRRSPRNSNLNEVTANNGAAENCSARHGSCYSYSGVSRSSHLLS